MMNGVTERQKKFIEDMNEFCREKFYFKGKTKIRTKFISYYYFSYFCNIFYMNVMSA